MDKEQITEAYIKNTGGWLGYTAHELTNCASAIKTHTEGMLRKLASYNIKKDGMLGLLFIIAQLEGGIEKDIRDLEKIVSIVHSRWLETIDRHEYKKRR